MVAYKANFRISSPQDQLILESINTSVLNLDYISKLNAFIYILRLSHL